VQNRMLRPVRGPEADGSENERKKDEDRAFLHERVRIRDRREQSYGGLATER